MPRSERNLVKLYTTTLRHTARLATSPGRHFPADDVTAVSPPGGAERSQRSADCERNYLSHDESKPTSASVYPWKQAPAGTGSNKLGS